MVPKAVRKPAASRMRAPLYKAHPASSPLRSYRRNPHVSVAKVRPKCGVRRPPYTRRVDERSGRRLAWSTAIFSLATGLSRIAGLIREVVAAYYFGAAGQINAFTVAFQVPNLIRALVADAALSSAFVPVFVDLLKKGDRMR